MKHKIIILPLLAIAISIIVASATYAQQSTPGGGSGLEIDPPSLTFKADPGQQIIANIGIKDISSGPLIVTSDINDFTAAGEDGTPKLVLDDTITPYSIKSWINPLAQMTLKPGKIVQMHMTINVPKSTSPGGYYGVVRFTATPPELEGTGVSFTASIGTMIFINVNGNVKENLAVKSFTASSGSVTGWLFESKPIDFSVKLQNTGNMFERPHGVIQIKDAFDKTVGNVIVNDGGRYILQQSTRDFKQSLNTSVIGNRQLFGRYTANLKVTYGAKNQTLTQTLVFWVIPWRLILVIVVILIGVIIALIFGIKRYNRFVVNKSHSYRGRRR